MLKYQQKVPKQFLEIEVQLVIFPIPQHHFIILDYQLNIQPLFSTITFTLMIFFPCNLNPCQSYLKIKYLKSNDKEVKTVQYIFFVELYLG